MAVDERQRRALYERAEQALGQDGADTLMALLPPVGWADVATKRDLDHLQAVMDRRFESVDRRFESVDQRIEASAQRVINTVTWRMLGMVVATAGLVAGITAPLGH